MTDPTRDAAFRLISAVLDRQRPLEEALDSLPGIEARDRAAAHRLAASVLRRLGTLDAVLEPFLRKSPPEPVRHILRLGAASLLFLETPPHAAVGTAVSLVHAQGLKPFAGLVNAVLRRVAAAGPAVLAELDSPRLDTPPWLWASWGEAARVIAIAHQSPAALDITLRPGVPVPDGGVRLPTGSIRFPAGSRVTELPGFEEGAFWVQDVGAALPAALLDVQPGEQVADLCAAPGGKTAQLAMTGAQVVAVDRDPARLSRLRDNMRRLRLSIESVEADAAAWNPPHLFDAILLDAPCSATGTIRRHPDVLHLKRQRDLTALAAAQDRLLEAAVGMLRPGGRLIYAVCSLQPPEGPARIETILTRGLVRLEPFSAAELAEIPEARTPVGYLRTHPGLWPTLGGMDGFFACRLVRTGV